MNIEIEIKNKKDIISPYNDKVLKEDFHNYLIDNCKMQKIEEITLTINNYLDEQELKDITELIHDYYKSLYSKAKTLDRYDDYMRMILFCLGIVFIILSEIFKNFISEIFLIIGWVFIWEIIYDLFFSQARRKRNAKIYDQLAKAKIKNKI